MNKQFPTKERAVFIVCEDIRQELGNKFSLQGVFSTRKIILENEFIQAKDEEKQQRAVLPSLAFHITFLDGEGEFESEAKILDPNGENLLKDSATNKNIKIDSNGAIMVYKFNPFPVKPGTYLIVISLDGQEYSETFEVLLRKPA
jgi:hypothetical protein